jgi:hypothetical protein
VRADEALERRGARGLRRAVRGENRLGSRARYRVREGLAVGEDSRGLHRREQLAEQRLRRLRDVRALGYGCSHDSVGRSLGAGNERM